jgi:hypothetical protein
MYGQNREGHTVLVPVLFLSLALLPPAAAHTKNLSLVNKQRFNTSTHALLKYFIKFSVAEPELNFDGAGAGCNAAQKRNEKYPFFKLTFIIFKNLFGLFLKQGRSRGDGTAYNHT